MRAAKVTACCEDAMGDRRTPKCNPGRRSDMSTSMHNGRTVPCASAIVPRVHDLFVIVYGECHGGASRQAIKHRCHVMAVHRRVRDQDVGHPLVSEKSRFFTGECHHSSETRALKDPIDQGPTSQ